MPYSVSRLEDYQDRSDPPRRRVRGTPQARDALEDPSRRPLSARTCGSVTMSPLLFRGKAPRPTFALDMSDEEGEIMARHAEYCRPWVESGQMVIFGPVLDGGGSWGLGVVESDDEEELRAFAADD